MNNVKEQLEIFKEQAKSFIFSLDSYFDEQDDFREIEMIYDIDESGFPLTTTKEELQEIAKTILAEKYTECATKWIMLAVESYNNMKNTILDGIENEIMLFLEGCEEIERNKFIACYQDLKADESFEQLMLEHLSLPDAETLNTDNYVSFCQAGADEEKYMLFIEDALDEIIDVMINYVTDIEIKLDDSFAELGLEIVEKYCIAVESLLKC